MTTRTFALNSPEFYEAVCEPRDRPWIPNGSLPRSPMRARPAGDRGAEAAVAGLDKFGPVVNCG
jgi:hypothetical protein